jgi:hypothetical protein
MSLIIKWARLASRSFCSHKELASLIRVEKEPVTSQDVIPDYTAKPSELPLSKLIPESENKLDLEGNELARQVLEKGEFDLLDPRVQVRAAELDLELPGVRQVGLGVGVVKKEDQVLLQDVDPLNIPEDKDIIFWGYRKEILLLGQRQPQPAPDASMRLSGAAFEEKGFRETVREYLLPGEARLAVLDWRELCRALVRYSLFGWLAVVWLYTCLEHRHVKKQQQLAELQFEQYGAAVRRRAVLEAVQI